MKEGQHLDGAVGHWDVRMEHCVRTLDYCDATMEEYGERVKHCDRRVDQLRHQWSIMMRQETIVNGRRTIVMGIWSNNVTKYWTLAFNKTL